jgi:integrase
VHETPVNPGVLWRTKPRVPHRSGGDRRSTRAIDGYEGQPITAAALKLAALVFVRPGELRGARWSEFDVDGAEWRIPAERMKMGELHIVPLARQAVATLRELQALTGGLGEHVFPSLLTLTRPMSNNTVNTALRRLGYTKEQMTGHGFRSIASTLLNEQGFHPDLIELQLSHAERQGGHAQDVEITDYH